MDTEFKIVGWEACAPGLGTPAHWLQWAAQPLLPHGELQVALPEVAPMLRRRLGELGRLALRAGHDGHGPELGMPVVFASRYGDAQRSLDLLRDHATGQALSPTDFALSVHNAIGALYSIARRDVASYCSVAAGPGSAAAGLVEAAGWLADGAPQVLLVCYDAPLPGDYAAFADEPAASYAWAWRVARPQPGEPHLSLHCHPSAAGDDAPAAALPFGLDVLRFALSQDKLLARRSGGLCWEWRRHA